MGPEDILYRLDPTKVRVVSGDIAEGYWELRACSLVRSPELFAPESETREQIDLDGQIQNLDIKNIKDANPAGNWVGIGVGALTGLRFFGPLGAIGGAVLGNALVGNRHEITVTVRLKSGKMFVLSMDKDVYSRLKLIGERSGATETSIDASFSK
ncbi:MAG: hypothetical protein K2X77_32395 [Candidatus Obscuribacterales bacterium]|jgi:hypothetical protein|nr:hypothetical protein [Candidatus Obscuribacterales bacterium]